MTGRNDTDHAPVFIPGRSWAGVALFCQGVKGKGQKPMTMSGMKNEKREEQAKGRDHEQEGAGLRQAL